MPKVPIRGPAQRVPLGRLPVKDLDAASRGFTAFGAALQKTLGGALEDYADAQAKTRINQAKNEFSTEVTEITREEISNAEENGEDLTGEEFEQRVTSRIQEAQQQKLNSLGILSWHPDTSAAAKGVLADIATAGAADAAKIAFQKKLSNSRNEYDLDAEASAGQFVRDADISNPGAITAALDSARTYYGDQARAQVAGGLRSNEDASRWAKNNTRRVGEGVFIKALDTNPERAKELLRDPDNPLGFEEPQRQAALQQANRAIDRAFAERSRETTAKWAAAVQAADTSDQLEALVQQGVRDKELNQNTVLQLMPTLQRRIDEVTLGEAYKSNAHQAVAGLSTVDFSNRQEVAALNDVILEREQKIIDNAPDEQTAVEQILQERVEVTSNLGKMPQIYQRQLKPNPTRSPVIEMQNAAFLNQVEERNPFALEGLDDQTLTYYSVFQAEMDAGRSPAQSQQTAARVVAPDVSGEREALRQMFNDERQGVWVTNEKDIINGVFGTGDVPAGARIRAKQTYERFYTLSLGDADVALQQTRQRMRSSSNGWSQFGEDWIPNGPSVRPEFQSRALPEGWQHEQFEAELGEDAEKYRIVFMEDPHDEGGPGYLLIDRETGTQLVGDDGMPEVWRPDAKTSPAWQEIEKTAAARQRGVGPVQERVLEAGEAVRGALGLDRKEAREKRMEAAQEENRRLHRALAPEKILRLEGALQEATEAAGMDQEVVPFDPNDPRLQKVIEEATQ